MSVNIAMFDTKSYDREMFNELNKNFGFSIKYFKFNITPDNAVLANGSDVICVFVNDIVLKEVIDILHEFMNFSLHPIFFRTFSGLKC